MFEDYKRELLAFYHHQKKENPLSGNLANLQRSNLRKMCLQIFAKKHDKEDCEIIKAFFDPTNKFSDHIISIERVELDRFRPLVGFLQRGINIRDDASVKLIAWLIDFDSFQKWRVKKKAGQVIPVDDEDNEPIDTSGKKLPGRNISQRILDTIVGRPFSIKNTTISCITLILLGTGAFFLAEKNTADTVRQPLADEKCMYWTGDHYEPVKCDEKIGNVTLIPINLRVLNNLKRISLTDTLTSYSLGKVWYSKINGKREFFTDSGMHPVDTSRKLRPLSKYILSNYVSYYRYLFTHLTWSVCVIITVVPLIVYVIYFFKRQKKPER